MPGSGFGRLSYTLARDGRINPTDKLLLIVLQQWGWQSGECFPSDDSIAEAAAISRRSVQRSLKKLQQLKLIRIVPDNTNPTKRRIHLVYLKDSTFLPPLALTNPAETKRPGKATKSGVTPPNPDEEFGPDTRETIGAWVDRDLEGWLAEGLDRADMQDRLYTHLAAVRACDRVWLEAEQDLNSRLDGLFGPEVDDSDQ